MNKWGKGMATIFTIMNVQASNFQDKYWKKYSTKDSHDDAMFIKEEW